MFTGIIESMGVVAEVKLIGSNRTFWIESPLSVEFKVDQSISHSGVCLTVEEIAGTRHRVTAIEETIRKTNLGQWKAGDIVNLERCLSVNGRLDGHFVQGHVDTTGTCLKRSDKKGSWEFEIEFPGKFGELVIEKGSICLEGVSLTAFNTGPNIFTVAIIPYTFQHTNLNRIMPGDELNIEFDLLGKYILRRQHLSNKANP